MRGIQAFAIAAAVALLAFPAGRAQAQVQGFDFLWQVAPAQSPGDWSINANWRDTGNTTSLVPDAAFDEDAFINNGGTAFVAAGPPSVPNLVNVTLGQNAGQSGILEIRNGGNLGLVSRPPLDGSSTVPRGGAITVGGGGTGTLKMLGGSLTAVNASVGGGGLIDFTGGTLSMTGGLTNSGTTRVRGTAPNITLGSYGGNGTLVAEITGLNHSAIKATSAVLGGGTVRVEFNGHTPALGQSWTLIDANNIRGAFAGVDYSAAPAPAAGTTYYMEYDAGGSGNAVLKYSNTLTLSIERSTGNATLKNVVGSIPFNGYTMTSAAGRLNTAWTGVNQANWLKSTPPSLSANRLTEFNAVNSLTLGANATAPLGQAWTPALFGVEDVRLDFNMVGGGTVPALVEFTGPPNNLMLTIDPSSGKAALQNLSPFAIPGIDGYSIHSITGKLNVAGWTSFEQSQPGAAEWFKAPLVPTANDVGDLKRFGSMPIPANTTINLGDLFTLGNIPALSDLSLEFHIANGESRFGVVQFGTLSSVIKGDMNGDNAVNNLDIFPFSLALTDPAAYDQQFPGLFSLQRADINIDGAFNNLDISPFVTLLTAGPASAVPEPNALTLGLLACAGLLVRTRMGSRGRGGRA